MAGKRGDFGSRAVSGIAGAAAAFVARKVMTFAWTRITGKEPPEHPEDPQVALREALGWALITGAGVGTARMLASRAAGRRTAGAGSEPAELPPARPAE
jgi:Protein of unknown function (DUF4235)